MTLIWESDDKLTRLEKSDENYRLRVDREGYAAISDKLTRDELIEFYQAIGSELYPTS